MRAYRAVVAVLAIDALLFLVGLSLLNPYYVEVCEAAKDGAQPNCPTQHIDLFLLGKLGEAFSSTNFVTTMATVAIAFFTFSLMVSTKRMWLATKISADAAHRSADITERALAQLEGPIIEQCRLELTIEPEITPAVRMWFKNRGRGPGRVLQIAGRFVMLPGGIIPPTPDYGRVFGSLLTLGAGEETTDPVEFRLEVPSGEGSEMVSLFCFGFIRYRGVLGGETTFGFGYRPNRETMRFDGAGGNAYNYRRYDASADNQ